MIMSKFKDICKGFFGLQEVINVSAEKYDAIKDKIDPEVEVNITETELEEAQLINKKGFTIIKHEKSTSGRTGYFYFRIGEDPGSESQKIQGYFAQLPELVKFAFKAPRSKQPKQMKRRKF